MGDFVRKVTRWYETDISTRKELCAFQAWHFWGLAIACAFFTISSVNARIDHRAYRHFIDTIDDSQIIFVTTTKDCLKLIEGIERFATRPSVPVRILLIKDGVSDESISTIIAASSHPIELVSWRNISPFRGLVRTPFAISFDTHANVRRVESVVDQTFTALSKISDIPNY